jgi:predicted PurR-regulated permease PerM
MTGGVTLFGLVGLVVGPLLAAALITLIDVFDKHLNSDVTTADI